MKAGITINGLAIINEHPVSWTYAHVQPPGGLANYYRENVTGGPGQFCAGSARLPHFRRGDDPQAGERDRRHSAGPGRLAWSLEFRCAEISDAGRSPVRCKKKYRGPQPGVTDMGLLIDGVWHEQEPAGERGRQVSAGRFVRTESAFRNWVTPDGGRARPAATASPHSPGAITSTCRSLVLGASRADPARPQGARDADPGLGHALADGRTAAGHSRRAGRGPRSAVRRPYLPEIYTSADGHYSGRVSVPVLWDKHTQAIVNNELSEIIRMLNGRSTRWAPSRATTIRRNSARDRGAQHAHLRHAEQRGLQGRFRYHAGSLRGGGAAAVRHA